jgi:hypothetical protein
MDIEFVQPDHYVRFVAAAIQQAVPTADLRATAEPRR